MNTNEQHNREMLFHDQVVESLNEDSDFCAEFESPTASELRTMNIYFDVCFGGSGV